MEPIVIGRAKNNSSLNGLEFLLKEPYVYQEFQDIDAAKVFIREQIFPDSTDEEIEDYFTFMTKQEAIDYVETKAEQGEKH